MPKIEIRLIVGCMLVLGGSTVLGQMPNQLFPTYQQNNSSSRPGSIASAGNVEASVAGSYDDLIIDLEVRDTLVYCGMGDGLMILDISDPLVPELVSRIYFPEEMVRDLKLRGDYIYLCAGVGETGMFRVIDVSDPAAPLIAGSYPRPGVSGLDVVDSLAFVVIDGSNDGGFNAMFVFDIGDPQNIVLVDSVFLNNIPYKVKIQGDRAYVTGFGGLYTIDISVPSEATILSQFLPDINYIVWELDLKEDDSLVYVADLGSIWPVYHSAFSVYNVADPENPSLWGRYPLIAYVADVKIKDDFAYVSNGSCGLQVFDISDPTAPDSVGRYQAPSDWTNYVKSSAGRMAIQGNLLLLADIGPGMIVAEAYSCYASVPEAGDPSPGDLIILDISEPTEPTLLSHYTPSDPTDVDDENVPDALPSAFALYQNYPNPFNPATSIRFDLPRRCEIKLTVYNLLGQEVLRLVREMSAGHQSLELEMKDQSSGVYFYELQTADFSETKKMLLLK